MLKPWIVGFAVALLAVASACGGSGSDYYDSVAKALKTQSDDTQRIFGDGRALFDCNQAAAISLAKAQSGCQAYFEQIDRLGASLSKLRASIAKLTPPDRATDWHARFLTFLDGAISDIASGADAFRRDNYAAFAKFEPAVSSIPARGDVLLAELERLH